MKTELAPSKVMKPTSGKIKFEPQSPLRYIIVRDLFLLIICQSLPNTHCCPHPSLEWSSFSSFDTIKFACYLFYRAQGLVQGRQMPHLPLLLFLLRWDLINFLNIVLNLLCSPGKPWTSDPPILASGVVGIKGLHHQIKPQHFIGNSNLIGIVAKRQKINPTVNSNGRDWRHHLGATKAS